MEMLHSILFLTLVLFPTIWTKQHSRAIKDRPLIALEEWSLRHLMLAFKKLSDQDKIRTNLCLIIDGVNGVISPCRASIPHSFPNPIPDPKIFCQAINTFPTFGSNHNPNSSNGSFVVKEPLRLNSENEFQITIFADLHYGEEENGWGIDQDVNSSRVIRDVISHEKSDLAIFNGDLITGENTFLENSTRYMDKWASIYGNHDTQYNLSREALFLADSKYSLSYTRHSPPGIDGVTNYYLPIYPSLNSKSSPNAQNPETPLAILYFFDSQGGAPFQAPSTPNPIPDYVTPSIVSWFLTTRSYLSSKYGDGIPSLAFVHIPPSSFLELQSEVLTDPDVSLPNYPGLNADLPLAAEGDGVQDIPFKRALVSTKGLHSVHSGHDHGDAWCGDWPVNGTAPGREEGKGPFLCFGKHSGYGGYGNWNRGARILKLGFGKEGEMDVETWIRMEGGGVVQRVKLNETYGVNLYPIDDGE
ncbi:hypothetical protein NHQ30_004058 [Ciborinia camelliae]|nr:hypothetical protein NHQ30_004058 [Ciborinia camelliae]